MKFFRLICLLPLLLGVAVVMSSGAGEAPEASESESPVVEGLAQDSGQRLVVVLLDSLRPESLDTPGLMPRLAAFSELHGVRRFGVNTCVANLTYPCMQTLFEGRQGPFVAGANNFSGAKLLAENVPADLKRAGRRVAILSDVTLVSQFGEAATVLVNVEDWPISTLDRDLKALDMLETWLDDPSIDDIIVHLPGTDRVAHYQMAHSAEYQEHFQRVDERLGEVLQKLDLARDQLLITGDHGHLDDGHHTRDSLAIIAGGLYDELLAQLLPIEVLEQPELNYFMRFAAGLALPRAYEGRYFLATKAREGAPTPRAQAFMARTHRQLIAAGYGAQSLREAAASHQRDVQRVHEYQLREYFPLLLAFGVWLLVFFGAQMSRDGRARDLRLHLGVAALILVVWSLRGPTWPAGVGLSALALAALLGWSWRFRQGRAAAWALLLGIATAFIALNLPGWEAFFHTRGGFVPAQPIFYLMLPLIGLALAWVAGADWRSAPMHAMAFCLFCLPAGVYYYQFGQNMFWGCLLAGVLVGGVSLVRADTRASARERLRAWRGAEILAAVVLCVSAVLLILQEASRWQWVSYPAEWLANGPLWVGVLVEAAIISWVASQPAQRRQRMLLAGWMVVAALLAVWFGKLPLGWFVAAQAPLLLVAAWQRLRDTPVSAAQRLGHAMLLWGAVVATTWAQTRGFFINNLDFNFGFEYFAHLRHEQAIFLGIGALTLVKYGVAIFTVLLVARVYMGADAWREVSSGLILVGLAHGLALMVQLSFTALHSAEMLGFSVEASLYILAIHLLCLGFIGLEALATRLLIRR